MSDNKDAEMLAPGSPSRKRLKTEQIIEEAKKKKEVRAHGYDLFLKINTDIGI